jgi:Outer membrane protein beta-barrel family
MNLSILIKQCSILLFWIAILCPAPMVCQTYTLSGKITDIHQKALEFVTIQVFQDTTLVSLFWSDSAGYYECNPLAMGSYRIAFFRVGLKSMDTTLLLSKNLKLDCILEYSSQLLSEVEVKSRKPMLERKSDRLIFNVEQSVFNSGSEVLTLIGKIPGLRVQQGNITMIGKSNVLVMVDDRLIPLSSDDLATFLSTLSTDGVSKIEFITNPPAKYDAQGNSGLINIVTKKITKQGVFAVGRVGIKQATFATYNAGINVDYFKKQLRLSTALDGNMGTIQGTGFTNTYYATQTWEHAHKLLDQTHKFGAKIKLDYALTSKSKIGFLYTHHTTVPSFDDWNQVHVSSSLSLDSVIHTQIFSKEHKTYNAFNFSIQHLIDSTGKKMFIDADGLDLAHDQSSDLSSTNFLATGQLSTTEKNTTNQQKKLSLYTLRNDYTFPFKTWELSLGGKLSFLKNESDVRFYQFLKGEWVFYKPLSDIFKYGETIQSLYASASKESDTWNVQFGFRYENTQIQGISVSNHQTFVNAYWRVFPTFSLSYQWNESNTLSFNYNKRIDRPNYDLLNPFRQYSTPYSYETGNPFLTPALTHNFEIAHTFKGVLNTTLSYRNERDKYASFVSLSDSNRVQASTYSNYLSSKSFVFDIGLLFHPYAWVESTTQLSLESVQTQSTLAETLPRLSGVNTAFSSIAEFKFNKAKSFMGGLEINYQFPFIDGLEQISSYFTVNAHLKINLFKDKFQIFIEGDDLFKTAQPHYLSIFNHVRQNASFYRDNRSVKIVLKYKIGKEKKQKEDKEERKTSNAEELLRIKQ